MKEIINFWVGIGKSFVSRIGGRPIDTSGPVTPTKPPKSADPELPVDLSPIDINKAGRPITHIILHHSATKDGVVNDWPAIKKYHTSYRVDFTPVTKEQYEAALTEAEATGKKHTFELPDLDIGYNLGVEKVGEVYVVQYGRSLKIPGAHCKQNNMNRCSVGICAIGDFDKETPPVGCWKETLKSVKAVQKALNIPTGNVQGHCVYATYKSCPGKKWDMNQFKKDLDALA